MGHATVTLNGNPVGRAIVVVTGIPVIFGIGGYNARAVTDSNGNAEFADPTLWDYPQGSTADIDAKWVDSQGNEYYATSSIMVVGNWNVSTGFEGWSPDPVALDLAPAKQLDPIVKQTADTNISNQAKSDVSKGLFGDQLNTLLWIAVIIVVAYLFINLILPSIQSRGGGAR